MITSFIEVYMYNIRLCTNYSFIKLSHLNWSLAALSKYSMIGRAMKSKIWSKVNDTLSSLA